MATEYTVDGLMDALNKGKRTGKISRPEVTNFLRVATKTGICRKLESTETREGVRGRKPGVFRFKKPLV